MKKTARCNISYARRQDDIYGNVGAIYTQIKAWLMKGPCVYEANLLKLFRHHFRAFKESLPVVLVLVLHSSGAKFVYEHELCFKARKREHFGKEK